MTTYALLGCPYCGGPEVERRLSKVWAWAFAVSTSDPIMLLDAGDVANAIHWALTDEWIGDDEGDLEGAIEHE